MPTDTGCGTLGWLRVLSRWVGPSGHVVGTDNQSSPLEAARAFVDDESLNNVELVEDDLFASALEPASFDLVHARFLLAPLGRFDNREELDRLRAEAQTEIAAPGRWGTTFTLIQAWRWY